MEKKKEVYGSVPSQKKHRISNKITNFFISIYGIFQFIKRFFKEAWRPPYEVSEIIKQCYNVGYRSLALISLTGFIIGIVFTKQSRPSLASFGATSWLPSLIGIAVIRALAPLITALIAAGKIGSNIGAELGSMKVTEQIDAMEVSATNPFKFLAVSRILATTLMLPLLSFYTAFIAMIGSFFNVHANESTSFTAFFKDAFIQISFLDLNASIIKALVFGFTIGVTGCYKGFNATKGTEGVGRAANEAVVVSMFLVFIEEMLIVQVVNYLRGM
ncbi:MAG: ABC transporter permease [Bacteroidota bacterium]|nr:ABC transporter permease [Bacteroidota bacterium]